MLCATVEASCTLRVAPKRDSAASTARGTSIIRSSGGRPSIWREYSRVSSGRIFMPSGSFSGAFSSARCSARCASAL
jgi:hypothetical protein